MRRPILSAKRSVVRGGSFLASPSPHFFRTTSSGYPARIVAVTSGIEHRRRSQRKPADGAWLRRVLRQPLPPQRRGRAGACRTIRRIPTYHGEVRAARRASAQGDRRGRSDGGPALRQDRQAEDRGHRRADQEAHGDDRRRDAQARPSTSSSGRQAAGKPFFCWFNATRMHLSTHVRAEHRGRYTHGDSEYGDGMIEHDGDHRQATQSDRRSRHRRQHHRRLHDRQRPAHELLAGRRHDAVPRREEHKLGRRLPRAVRCVRWPGVIKPGTIYQRAR